MGNGADFPDELRLVPTLRALKEMGLIASYFDYLDLPWGLVEDAGLVLEAENIARERAAKESRGNRR